MEKQPKVNLEHVQRGLIHLGIETGSSVMVHSSLSSFGYVEGGALTVIQALVQQVSKEGTILMPAFVQKINGKKASYMERRKVWDIRKSPSDVGLITETFRKMKGVVRSDHPICSISAWGKGANEATEGQKTAYGRPSYFDLSDETCFGIGSPWDWMYEHNTHYLFIGVDFNVCSILHYAQALYAEQNGLYKEKPPQWPDFNFVEMGNLLKKRGLVNQVQVGNSIWLHIRSKVLIDESLQILRDNPNMIKKIKILTQEDYDQKVWDRN